MRSKRRRPFPPRRRQPLAHAQFQCPRHLHHPALQSHFFGRLVLQDQSVPLDGLIQLLSLIESAGHQDQYGKSGRILDVWQQGLSSASRSAALTTTTRRSPKNGGVETRSSTAKPSLSSASTFTRHHCCISDGQSDSSNRRRAWSAAASPIRIPGRRRRCCLPSAGFPVPDLQRGPSRRPASPRHRLPPLCGPPRSPLMRTPHGQTAPGSRRADPSAIEESPGRTAFRGAQERDGRTGWADRNDGSLGAYHIQQLRLPPSPCRRGAATKVRRRRLSPGSPSRSILNEEAPPVPAPPGRPATACCPTRMIARAMPTGGR